MIDGNTMNMLAMMADSEQRSTASLIEMIAAAVLVKTNPPARFDDVVQVTIGQGDLSALMTEHHYEARYTEDGTMTLFLTPLRPESEQNISAAAGAEVTSD